MSKKCLEEIINLTSYEYGSCTQYSEMMCEINKLASEEVSQELFLWAQDLGVDGSIIVIASSEENARKQMKDMYNYSASAGVKKHIIKEGLIFCNLGDC